MVCSRTVCVGVHGVQGRVGGGLLLVLVSPTAVTSLMPQLWTPQHAPLLHVTSNKSYYFNSRSKRHLSSTIYHLPSTIYHLSSIIIHIDGRINRTDQIVNAHAHAHVSILVVQYSITHTSNSSFYSAESAPHGNLATTAKSRFQMEATACIDINSKAGAIDCKMSSLLTLNGSSVGFLHKSVRCPSGTEPNSYIQVSTSGGSFQI